MSKPTSKDTLAIFWQHAKHYPTLVIGSFLAVPITTLLNNLLPPLILAQIIQRLASGDYVRGDLMGSFGPYLIGYSVLVMSGILGWRLVDLFMWRLEARIVRDLAHTVYNHLLSLSANFHANSFGGSLVSHNNKLLGAYIRIADTTAYSVLPMIWGIIFTSIILSKRAPIFVVAFLIITFFYILVAILLTQKTRISSANHAEAESEQTGVLADSVSNVLAIKSYSGQKHENKRFRKYTGQTRRYLYAYYRDSAIQLSAFAAFTRLVQIAAIFIATYSIVSRNANLATVFLILNYSSIIAEQLFNFSQNSLKNYNRSFGDAQGMTRILNIESEIKDPKQPESLRMKDGQIVLNNITFTHDGSAKPLFRDFSLSIKSGEKVGLVGHSGSGKTTLTRLLLRFSDVDSGELLIDGQNIRNVTQDDLHDQITYVPQEPLLFHRTLAENIGYGSKQATQGQIERVSKLAHSHEFIQELPSGYDTLVGERGVKLSGGQRQRVAIARAMIKDAPIVLLDEATSALDSESEILIQKALWTLMANKTAIVIAHRLSTIQRMDRIVVLDNGKIIEEGSHKELLAKHGKYAELWAHQSGGFIEE